MSVPGAAPADDRARAMLGAAVEPALAFALFTGQMGLWWRRGQRCRIAEGDRDLLTSLRVRGTQQRQPVKGAGPTPPPGPPASPR